MSANLFRDVFGGPILINPDRIMMAGGSSWWVSTTLWSSEWQSNYWNNKSLRRKSCSNSSCSWQHCEGLFLFYPFFCVWSINYYLWVVNILLLEIISCFTDIALMYVLNDSHSWCVVLGAMKEGTDDLLLRIVFSETSIDHGIKRKTVSNTLGRLSWTINFFFSILE